MYPINDYTVHQRGHVAQLYIATVSIDQCLAICHQIILGRCKGCINFTMFYNIQFLRLNFCVSFVKNKCRYKQLSDICMEMYPL